MKRSRFIGSVIRETDFINVELKDADFSGCDLLGSSFHNANLENASFIGAINYSIDPRSNKLKKARFEAPEVLSLLDVFDIRVEPTKE